MTLRAAILLAALALAAGCGRKDVPARPVAEGAPPPPPLIELPADQASEPAPRRAPPIPAAGPVAPELLRPPGRLSPDRSPPGVVDPRRIEQVFDDSI